MKKENKSLRQQISLAVIVFLILGFWLSNHHELFGVYIPIEMADSINSNLSLLFIISAIWLHIQRKKPDAELVKSGLAVILSLALFVIGFRFVAGETGAYSMNISNDGFTVTGGFLMFLSGLILGSFAKKSSLNSSDSKKKSLKQLKEESAKNFEDLGKAAQEISKRKAKKS